MQLSMSSRLLVALVGFASGCGDDGGAATDGATTSAQSTSTAAPQTSGEDPTTATGSSTAAESSSSTGAPPTTTEALTGPDATSTSTSTTGDATSTSTTSDATSSSTTLASDTTTGTTAADTDADTDTGAPACITWERTYGAAQAEYGNAIVHIPGAGFAIAGRTSSRGAGGDDMWLVRLDEAGDLLWDRTYGTASTENANGLALAPDGGFLLVGTSFTPQSSLDWWVVRTDADGDLLWDQTFATMNADHAFAAVSVAEGGFAVAGSRDRIAQGSGRFWLIRLADDGAVLWEEIYGDLASEQLAYDLVELPGDGFALAGTADADFWLVRTDLDGNLLWDRAYDFGGGNYDRALGLARTPDGGLALAGWTQKGAGSDYWVVRTDAGGDPLWTHHYDREEGDLAEDVAVLPDGGLVVIGSSRVKDGDADLWLVRTDPDGALVWERSYGGPQYDGGKGVAALPGGQLALVGRTFSQGAGDGDAWALRTDPGGSLACE